MWLYMTLAPSNSKHNQDCLKLNVYNWWYTKRSVYNYLLILLLQFLVLIKVPCIREKTKHSMFGVFILFTDQLILLNSFRHLSSLYYMQLVSDVFVNHNSDCSTCNHNHWFSGVVIHDVLMLLYELRCSNELEITLMKPSSINNMLKFEEKWKSTISYNEILLRTSWS